MTSSWSSAAINGGAGASAYMFWHKSSPKLALPKAVLHHLPRDYSIVFSLWLGHSFYPAALP
jgi:hypothetical protein